MSAPMPPVRRADAVDLAKYDHIPDATLDIDIADTEIEIKLEQRHIAIWTTYSEDNKLDIYKARGRIAEREEFITKLRDIIQFRKERSK